MHVRDEWPMGSQDFLTYLNGKYSAEELTNIHHYETKVIRDAANNLIQPAGVYVDSDHSITYVDRGVTTTKSEITSVTFLEHETNVNDKKRNINILRRELLDTFFRDINNIMTYKESNQFVTDKLKETNRLYSELEHSIALESLVPDVFKIGKAKSKWVLNGYNEPQRFIVTNSEGVEF